MADDAKKTEEVKEEVATTEAKPNAKGDAKPEATAEEAAAPVVKKQRKIKKHVPHGHAYIQSTFNNTLVTITDPNGATLSWASAGSNGFKGSRKSTPYAAQIAAENAVEKASVYGLEKVKAFIKGVGPGREQAIRGLQAAGVNVESITDITPLPHNGCRAKKSRRI